MSRAKAKAKAVESESNEMGGKRKRHPIDLLVHQIMTNPGEVDIAMISRTYPNDANRAASEAYFSQNWERLIEFRGPLPVNGLIISCVLVWAISSNSYRTLMQELVAYCKSYLQLPESTKIPNHPQITSMWYNIIYGHYIAGLARREDLCEVDMEEIVRRYGTPEEIEACNRFARKNEDEESADHLLVHNVRGPRSRDLRMKVMEEFLQDPTICIFDRCQREIDTIVQGKAGILMSPL